MRSRRGGHVRISYPFANPSFPQWAGHGSHAVSCLLRTFPGLCFPHLEASTHRGCGRPGLCFHVCPVSVEAALVCGLASLLPTLPMRSRTVCSPSQACLLLLIPGNLPLPSLGAAYRHSMDDNCWETQPCLERSHSFQDINVRDSKHELKYSANSTECHSPA